MLPSDLTRRRIAQRLLLSPLGVSTGTSRWATTAVRPDDAQLLDGLRGPVESGVELIDTADSHLYGHAERLIGKVLKENPGHTVRVSSTVGRVRGSAPHPYAGPRVRHQLEQTLENLYLDELAVYTLESYDFGSGDRYLDPVTEQLRLLRAFGLIRAIGLRGPNGRSSACCVRRFVELFDQIRPDVVWTQASVLIPLVDVGGCEDLAAFTARRGAGLLIASPLANGVLVGRRPETERLTASPAGAPSPAIAHGLAALSDQFGPSDDALLCVALRFILRQAKNAAVVVGVGDRHQVGRYLSCLGRPLSSTDLVAIEEALRCVRRTMSPTANRA
jgi:aryl-alcohol dehydrogenase-like predicted oxidoreductase